MFDAITSLLSKTLDGILKINSSEMRRRRLGRFMFQLYERLGEAAQGLDRLEQTIRARDVYSVDSLYNTVDLEIANCSGPIGQLSHMLSTETWDLFQAQSQPDRLRAMGIYDPELVNLLVRAWFSDGGFVEALLRLGLKTDIGRRELTVLDATFSESDRRHGYEIEHSSRSFKLDHATDVETFLELLASTRQSIRESHAKLRAFIAANYKVEDIL
jgi:hypothetical protein